GFVEHKTRACRAGGRLTQGSRAYLPDQRLIELPEIGHCRHQFVDSEHIFTRNVENAFAPLSRGEDTSLRQVFGQRRHTPLVVDHVEWLPFFQRSLCPEHDVATAHVGYHTVYQYGA